MFFSRLCAIDIIELFIVARDWSESKCTFANTSGGSRGVVCY